MVKNKTRLYKGILAVAFALVASLTLLFGLTSINNTKSVNAADQLTTVGNAYSDLFTSVTGNATVSYYEDTDITIATANTAQDIYDSAGFQYGLQMGNTESQWVTAVNGLFDYTTNPFSMEFMFGYTNVTNKNNIAQAEGNSAENVFVVRVAKLASATVDPEDPANYFDMIWRKTTISCHTSLLIEYNGPAAANFAYQAECRENAVPSMYYAGFYHDTAATSMRYGREGYFEIGSATLSSGTATVIKTWKFNNKSADAYRARHNLYVPIDLTDGYTVSFMSGFVTSPEYYEGGTNGYGTQGYSVTTSGNANHRYADSNVQSIDVKINKIGGFDVATANNLNGTEGVVKPAWYVDPTVTDVINRDVDTDTNYEVKDLFTGYDANGNVIDLVRPQAYYQGGVVLANGSDAWTANVNGVFNGGFDMNFKFTLCPTIKSQIGTYFTYMGPSSGMFDVILTDVNDPTNFITISYIGISEISDADASFDPSATKANSRRYTERTICRITDKNGNSLLTADLENACPSMAVQPNNISYNTAYTYQADGNYTFNRFAHLKVNATETGLTVYVPEYNGNAVNNAVYNQGVASGNQTHWAYLPYASTETAGNYRSSVGSSYTDEFRAVSLAGIDFTDGFTVSFKSAYSDDVERILAGSQVNFMQEVPTGTPIAIKSINGVVLSDIVGTEDLKVKLSGDALILNGDASEKYAVGETYADKGAIEAYNMAYTISDSSSTWDSNWYIPKKGAEVIYANQGVTVDTSSVSATPYTLTYGEGATAITREVNVVANITDIVDSSNYFVRGASVRIDKTDATYNGIRFHVVMRRDIYDRVIARDGDATQITMGTRIKRDGIEASVFAYTYKSTGADAEDLWHLITVNGVEYMESIVYLYGMPEEHFATGLICEGFVTESTADTNEVSAVAGSEYSMSYVASEAKTQYTYQWNVAIRTSADDAAAIAEKSAVLDAYIPQPVA